LVDYRRRSSRRRLSKLVVRTGALWATLAIVVEVGGGSFCVVFNRLVWLGASNRSRASN
jgi:hypothetical protein